jgi:hypothetical protein
MIDVKEAAEAAAGFLANVYADRNYSDVLLEEVEITDDGKYWLITLSYAYEPPASVLDQYDVLVHRKPKPRRYKTFKIEADTGRVLAMKIREAALL